MKTKTKILVKDRIKDSVDRSDELDKKLDAMPESIDETVKNLIDSGKRTKRLIHLVILSIFIEAALTIGISLFFISQSAQNVQITINKQNLIANCKSNNDFRDSQVKVWNYVLAIPSTTPQTPAQQKTLANFKTYVDNTFALRNCDTFVK